MRHWVPTQGGAAGRGSGRYEGPAVSGAFRPGGGSRGQREAVREDPLLAALLRQAGRVRRLPGGAGGQRGRVTPQGDRTVKSRYFHGVL